MTDRSYNKNNIINPKDKSGPRTDQFINIPFSHSTEDMVEYDRSVDLSLVPGF
jgi:uncharacterized protein (DUF924 family)